METGKDRTMSGEFKWKKGDLAAVFAVAVFAASIFLLFVSGGYGKTAGTAEIYLNGEKVREVNLFEDQSFALQGEYENRVMVKDGKIAVSESDCPEEDCVHTGWRSCAGESIVCLPNHMEIRIKGESDVDFVTGK